MEKIRTNDLFSSQLDFLQPRTSNSFLIQNKKIDNDKDIQFDILLDKILSNLTLIKNQIKF
jgi:hypothetical protein